MVLPGCKAHAGGSQGSSLRLSYAMSGTDIRYAAVLLPCHPTPFIARCITLGTCYTVSGTDRGYGATRWYGKGQRGERGQQREPLPTLRVSSYARQGDVRTRYKHSACCYAACGTDIANAGQYSLRRRWKGRKQLRSPQTRFVPAYALPTRCPVLTYRIQGTSLRAARS
eukprot:2643788-Rhodomonas_salina.1